MEQKTRFTTDRGHREWDRKPGKTEMIQEERDCTSVEEVISCVHTGERFVVQKTLTLADGYGIKILATLDVTPEELSDALMRLAFQIAEEGLPGHEHSPKVTEPSPAAAEVAAVS